MLMRKILVFLLSLLVFSHLFYFTNTVSAQVGQCSQFGVGPVSSGKTVLEQDPDTTLAFTQDFSANTYDLFLRKNPNLPLVPAQTVLRRTVNLAAQGKLEFRLGPLESSYVRTSTLSILPVDFKELYTFELWQGGNKICNYDDKNGFYVGYGPLECIPTIIPNTVGKNEGFVFSVSNMTAGQYDVKYQITGASEQILPVGRMIIDRGGKGSVVYAAGFTVPQTYAIYLHYAALFGSRPLCNKVSLLVEDIHSAPPISLIPTLEAKPAVVGRGGVAIVNWGNLLTSRTASSALQFFKPDGSFFFGKQLSGSSCIDPNPIALANNKTGSCVVNVATSWDFGKYRVDLVDVTRTPNVILTTVEFEVSSTAAPVLTPTPGVSGCGPGAGCVVSAGQPCTYKFSVGKLTPFSATGPGLSTAIGCIPTNPKDLIAAFYLLAISIGGGVAFLMMIYGVFQLLTSAGSPEGLKNGQAIITNAIIGILFILLSVLLFQTIGFNILRLPGFNP